MRERESNNMREKRREKKYNLVYIKYIFNIKCQKTRIIKEVSSKEPRKN